MRWKLLLEALTKPGWVEFHRYCQPVIHCDPAWNQVVVDGAAHRSDWTGWKQDIPRACARRSG